MKIFSYMIVKNEADRYLERSLTSLQSQVDGLFVLDDGSADGTAEILDHMKIPYRFNNRESFLEDESKCRQNAWLCMEKELLPRLGDWILTLDADEILRSRRPLKEIVRLSERDNHDGLILPVREMWQEDQMRIDGFWGTVTALRLAQWRPNGTFKAEQMGGGSLPTYVSNRGFTSDAEILHYGYTKVEDRTTKHDRYKSKPGRHNKKHIDSILSQPMLAELPNMV